jgi:hypothetical protein
VRIEITPTPSQNVDAIDVYLTPEEADLLRQSLDIWAEEVSEGRIDRGWHTHIDRDPNAPELTVAVEWPDE